MLMLWTMDNGAWHDVHPDCGYTPFRGTKVAPTTRWQPCAGDCLVAPGTIDLGGRNSEIAGSLDFMATFLRLVGLELPTEVREGQRRWSTAATKPRS
jgi:arylsulfatase A-like enzyme